MRDASSAPVVANHSPAPANSSSSIPHQTTTIGFENHSKNPDRRARGRFRPSPDWFVPRHWLGARRQPQRGRRDLWANSHARRRYCLAGRVRHLWSPRSASLLSAPQARCPDATDERAAEPRKGFGLVRGDVDDRGCHSRCCSRPAAGRGVLGRGPRACAAVRRVQPVRAGGDERGDGARKLGRGEGKQFPERGFQPDGPRAGVVLHPDGGS